MLLKSPLYSSLVFFPLIYALICCHPEHQGSTVIHIDVDAKDSEVDPSSYEIELSSIVKLEMTDECTIGWITKVEYYKGRYYVLDAEHSNTLYLYDSMGQFIDKTHIGRGDKQINGQITYFNINKRENIIDVWDGQMNTFDLDLNLLYKTSYDHPSIYSFNSINDSTNLGFVQWAGKAGADTVYNYFVFSNGFSKIRKKILPMPSAYSQIVIRNSISSFNGRILFTSTFDNNIYTICNDSISILYNIDFDKYNLSQQDLYDNDLRVIINEVWNDEKIGGVSNPIENRDFISFQYCHLYKDFNLERRENSCLYSKTTKKLYCVRFFSPKIMPKIIVNSTFKEDSFIGIANPDAVIEYYKLTGFDQMKDVNALDNPYLVIFKLIENI